MGKDDSAGGEEYRLLNVGVHPPDLCDNAEQPGQDAHLWRAAGGTEAQVKERARMLSRELAVCHWKAFASRRALDALAACRTCFGRGCGEHAGSCIGPLAPLSARQRGRPKTSTHFDDFPTPIRPSTTTAASNSKNAFDTPINTRLIRNHERSHQLERYALPPPHAPDRL
jgi:hypothetical protein